jgi:hypothetical protein
MFIYLTIIFLFETRLLGKIKGQQNCNQSPISEEQPEKPRASVRYDAHKHELCAQRIWQSREVKMNQQLHFSI